MKKYKRITVTIPEAVFNAIQEIKIKESATTTEFLNVSEVCTRALIVYLGEKHGFKTN